MKVSKIRIYEAYSWILVFSEGDAKGAARGNKNEGDDISPFAFSLVYRETEFEF